MFDVLLHIAGTAILGRLNFVGREQLAGGSMSTASGGPTSLHSTLRSGDMAASGFGSEGEEDGWELSSDRRLCVWERAKEEKQLDRRKERKADSREIPKGALHSLT